VRSKRILAYALLAASGLCATHCVHAKPGSDADPLKGCDQSWAGPVRKFDCGALNGSDQFLPGRDTSLDEAIDGTTRAMSELSHSKATWKSVDLALPDTSARAYRFSWGTSPEGWFHEWYFVIAGGVPKGKGVRSLSCGTRQPDAGPALARCEAILRHLIEAPRPAAPEAGEIYVFGTPVFPRKDCFVEPGKLVCPEAILEVTAKAPSGDPDAVLDASVEGLSKGNGGLERNEAYACTAYGVPARCRELAFPEEDGVHLATVLAYPIDPNVRSRLSCSYRDGPVPALCGIQR